MDFNSRRITAVLENALVEDRATRDATSYACIDPNQRAAGTILAKQDFILAGAGCITPGTDVQVGLSGATVLPFADTSHTASFVGIRFHKAPYSTGPSPIAPVIP